MAYYNVCPNCGSNLDPDEKCDCESVKKKEFEKQKRYFKQIFKVDNKNGQLMFSFADQMGGAIRV